MVKIDLSALAHNLSQVKHLARGRPILAVVKADAYGHGAVPISLELQKLGVPYFGVSNCREGVELRRAGVVRPIILMGGCEPGEAPAVVEHELTPVLFDLRSARALNEEAIRRGGRVLFHLKIDTGMGRLGIQPEAIATFLGEMKRMEGLEMEGLMTHFSEADAPEKDFTEMQLSLLEKAIPEVNRMGFFPRLIHAANSAALIDFPPALMSLVRPGILLYGSAPSPEMEEKLDLRPVMSLVSRISFLKRVPPGTPISYGRTFVTHRESLIASVPIGYTHGYPRSLSNRGEALVRGRRVRVVGRVCMDWTMLDVTDVTGAALGDEVVLLGRQGKETITAWELATLADTIPYEIFCSVGLKGERIYIS